jgi:hypothetical protein
MCVTTAQYSGFAAVNVARTVLAWAEMLVSFVGLSITVRKRKEEPELKA